LTGMKRLSILLVAVAGLAAPSSSVRAYDDLTILSDEFDAAHTLTNWQRIYQVEGWGNDVLQQFDINTSRPGRMTMVPYTSSWYAEWRGELTFKTVTGDFIITTVWNLATAQAPALPAHSIPWRESWCVRRVP